MNMIENWDKSYMLEISLNEPDDFLKVKETLTRIGISSKKERNTLYQSCHLLHKQGRYFILHFKELFLLDGKVSTLSEEDLERRNAIATLLSDWGLVSIINFGVYPKCGSLSNIKIISHKDKFNWTLHHKYNIGNVKKIN